MKLLIFILLIFFSFQTFIKEKEIFVLNRDSVKVDLSKEISSNDTTIIAFWATSCKPCIEELELLKQNNIHKRIKIIAISISSGNNICDKLNFIKSRNWPFMFFFDYQNLAKKYFIENNFVDSKFYRKKNDDYVLMIPQNFIFVNGKFNKNVQNIKAYLNI